MEQLMFMIAAINIWECSDRYLRMQQLIIECEAIKMGNAAINMLKRSNRR